MNNWALLRVQPVRREANERWPNEAHTHKNEPCIDSNYFFLVICSFRVEPRTVYAYANERD